MTKKNATTTKEVIPPEIGPDRDNSYLQVMLDSAPLIYDMATQIRLDFAFGYRIQLPESPIPYRITVIDLDQDLILEDYEAIGGQILQAQRKYYVRYRIEIRQKDNFFFSHEYNCKGKNVYIFIPGGALGDALASFPYAQAFADTYQAKVTVVTGEWLIRLVRDLYPDLSFKVDQKQETCEKAYAVYVLGFASTPETKGMQLNPLDYRTYGMQASAAACLGLPRIPLKTRLYREAPREITEPYVCISSMATNLCKQWLFPDGWNTVVRFLKDAGFRVIDIDREPAVLFGQYVCCVPSEAEDRTGRIPLQKRIDLLKDACFFVGLPSGLSWLAWTLDVPVLMISGFSTDVSEFETPYRVNNRHMCHGCWNDTNLEFNQYDNVWCPRHIGTPREFECTRFITPKMVIETIKRMPQFQEHARQIRKE